MKNRPPPLQTPVTAPGQEDYFQAQDHSLTHTHTTNYRTGGKIRYPISIYPEDIHRMERSRITGFCLQVRFRQDKGNRKMTFKEARID